MVTIWKDSFYVPSISSDSKALTDCQCLSDAGNNYFHSFAVVWGLTPGYYARVLIGFLLARGFPGILLSVR